MSVRKKKSKRVKKTTRQSQKQSISIVNNNIIKRQTAKRKAAPRSQHQQPYTLPPAQHIIIQQPQQQPMYSPDNELIRNQIKIFNEMLLHSTTPQPVNRLGNVGKTVPLVSAVPATAVNNITTLTPTKTPPSAPPLPIPFIPHTVPIPLKEEKPESSVKLGSTAMRTSLTSLLPPSDGEDLDEVKGHYFSTPLSKSLSNPSFIKSMKPKEPTRREVAGQFLLDYKTKHSTTADATFGDLQKWIKEQSTAQTRNMKKRSIYFDDYDFNSEKMKNTFSTLKKDLIT